MTIDQIKAGIDLAVTEAYRRGFEDGKTEVSRSIAAAMASIATSPMPASEKTLRKADAHRSAPVETASVPTDVPDETETRDDHLLGETSRIKRAPKGLTEHVLRHVMANSLDLTMKEIQRRAAEYDNRVSPKTIYNDLRRHTELYERVGHDRWKLRLSADDFDALMYGPKEREGQEAPIQDS